MSPTVKRSPSLWWWTASLFLLAVGAIGLRAYYSGPALGPTVKKPVGVVVLPTPTTVPLTTSTKPPPVTKQPTTSAVPTTSPGPGSSPVIRVVGAVNRSLPVQISIPEIGVSSTLSILGLNPDGSVQVPSTTAQAGWYRYDVTPGQIGSAVILGHVDSYQGPGVFYRLNQLAVGSPVFVTLRNGRRLQFDVVGIRMFPKSNFPYQEVFGAREYPALNLVTCGGVFDSATGHYLSNIVVFTALVKK